MAIPEDSNAPQLILPVNDSDGEKTLDSIAEDAPPRRGRGRPPKPKDPLATTVTAPTSPRPRGRPPKTVDPAPVKKTPSESGRKRGRPPKVAKDVEEEKSVAAAPKPASVTGAPEVARRGRGRPPKAKMTSAEVGA